MQWLEILQHLIVFETALVSYAAEVGLSALTITNPINYSLLHRSQDPLYLRVTASVTAINHDTIQHIHKHFSVCIHTYYCPLNIDLVQFLNSSDLPITWEMWNLYCNSSHSEKLSEDLNVLDENRLHVEESMQAIAVVSLLDERKQTRWSSSIVYFCCASADSRFDSLQWLQNDIGLRESGSISRLKQFWHHHELDTKFTASSAASRYLEEMKRSTEDCEHGHCMYVAIGIKSASLHAPQRFAIRSSWLRSLRVEFPLAASSPSQVVFLPFFLVGRSVEVPAGSEVWDLLAKEQALFGDMLLPPEWDVEDSYFTLAEKTMRFITWLGDRFLLGAFLLPHVVAESHHRVHYLVLCDDDVYVDLPELAALLADSSTPRRRLYAGEVQPPLYRCNALCYALLSTGPQRSHRSCLQTDS